MFPEIGEACLPQVSQVSHPRAHLMAMDRGSLVILWKSWDMSLELMERARDLLLMDWLACGLLEFLAFREFMACSFSEFMEFMEFLEFREFMTRVLSEFVVFLEFMAGVYAEFTVFPAFMANVFSELMVHHLGVGPLGPISL